MTASSLSIYSVPLELASCVQSNYTDLIITQQKKKDFNRSIKVDLTDLSGYCKMVNKPLNSVASKCGNTRFSSEQLESCKLMLLVKAPPLQHG